MKSDSRSAQPGPPAEFALRFPSLLTESTLSESDLSLLSWLRSIPNQTFGCPFQRRSLRVDVEPLPKLQRVLMNVSIMDSASDLLSRSMASTSFHLSSTEAQQPDLKTMTTSVDRLFGEAITQDSFHQNQVTIIHDARHPQNSQLRSQPQNSMGRISHVSQGSLGQPYQNKSTPGTTRAQSLDSNASTVQEVEPPTRAKFLAVTTLEDVQAVRCAEFHPSGRVYAIGSNSKTLRVCAYPDLIELNENHVAYQPTVLFKRTKHHKVCVCLVFQALDLLAIFFTQLFVSRVPFTVWVGHRTENYLQQARMIKQ